MLINLINNIAFLVALVAASQIVISRFQRNALNRQLLLGLLFGGVAVLGMVNPVNFSPGVIFDGRSIVLSVVGVVGGGVAAAVAAGIAAIFRYQLGGSGAVVGVVVVIQSALLGVLARHWWLRRATQPHAGHYVGLGLVVQLAQFAAFSQLPNRAGFVFIEQTWWVLLLFYPLTTMLQCLLFRSFEQQLIDRQALIDTQAEVLRERSFLRSLINSLPDLVWLKDPNGVYLACNKRFEEFFGAGKQEIAGKTDYDFVDKELADFFRANDRAAMEKHGPSVNEEEVTFASDGHKEFLQTTKVPMHDDSGKLIGVLGIGHDITTIKSAIRDLENREKQLSFVLEGSELGFWDWNIAPGTVDRNERWAAMLGYSHDEIRTTTQQWTDFIHPDDRRRAWESIQSVLEGGSAKHRLEYRMLHKDGSVRWILDQAGVMHRDKDGKPLRMCGTHTDITESRAIQEELMQRRRDLESQVAERTADLVEAKVAAEAANHAKSVFLANMSHELRTPMDGVLGMIELARRRISDPDGLDKLDKAKGSAQRLLGVLNDILDLSKIEAERLVLEDLPLQLGDTFDNVAQVLGPKAAEKGLALAIDLPADLARWHLRGDPLRLGQILINLAGNAIKFTDAGSVSLTVQALDETGDALRLRFAVRDTGIGIDDETQKRLFHSFEQADNSMTRKYGGTGLGLTISKRLVGMMEGEIGVESTPGRGSTFWFVVPLKKLDQAAVPPAPTFVGESAEVRLKADHAGTRILLAEDEPINQEVTRWLLEDVRLVVDLADDGQQAVTLARKNGYAMILMDMQMPVMNGVEATQAIRALPGYADVPILAMTANAFDEDRDTCLAAGMNDHIGKPVVSEKLYETLLKWLQMQASR